MKRLPPALFAIGAALLAGAAQAQSATQPPATPLNGPAILRIDLSGARISPAQAYSGASTVGVSNEPRTAIGHSFARRGLTGSAGFLCGLDAGSDNNGAATALGYDPHGRFVGAKLSLAFK